MQRSFQKSPGMTTWAHPKTRNGERGQGSPEPERSRDTRAERDDTATPSRRRKNGADKTNSSDTKKRGIPNHIKHKTHETVWRYNSKPK